MNESDYQGRIISRIKEILPDCIVIKNDSSYMPGIPDLLILFEDKWAMLEVKVNKSSRHQANQDYYIDYLNSMSFASFIYPDIEEEVLYDLQCSLGSVRETRVSKS